jgi:REP element-mobilizing transposase RayT
MGRYRADENFPYFCTISVIDWVPVFIDERVIQPIIDSLRFCQEKKALQLFAYVVMPNHLHLIAAAENLHDQMRDFKRFTSRTIHDRLVAGHRATILEWLRVGAQRARRSRGEFSFWQDGFHPQVIRSRTVFDQKLRYLHENPIRKGLVARPAEWRYSSAGWYSGESEPMIEMDQIEW